MKVNNWSYVLIKIGFISFRNKMFRREKLFLFEYTECDVQPWTYPFGSQNVPVKQYFTSIVPGRMESAGLAMV
jgi:hypothetical protein